MSAAAVLPPSRRAWPALIRPRWRVWVIGVLVVAVAAFASFAVAFRGHHEPTSFDDWVLIRLYRHIGSTGARYLLDLTNPYVTTVLTVLVALATLLTRRWGLAVVACLAPTLAIVLTEFVFKPLIARRLSFYGGGHLFVVHHGHTFPSGHETGLASLTLECALFVLGARAARWVKVTVVAVLTLWTVGGGIGLVRNFYHFTTDVLAGVFVSVACVIACTLLADHLGRRVAAAPTVA
jgi:hypothetical protein